MVAVKWPFLNLPVACGKAKSARPRVTGHQARLLAAAPRCELNVAEIIEDYRIDTAEKLEILFLRRGLAL
jgi:hypothetical protein